MGVLLTTSVGITKSVFEPSEGGGSFLTHPAKLITPKIKIVTTNNLQNCFETKAFIGFLWFKVE